MSNVRKKYLAIIALLLLAGGLFFIVSQKHNSPKREVTYIHNRGMVQGTTYSIIYLQPDGEDLHPKIKSRLHQFDLSLSTYEPQSVISRINRNDTSVRTDADFEQMFITACEVSRQTEGAFDITVGPLIKAWGFSSSGNKPVKIPDVKAILPFVGYQKLKLYNHRLIKSHPKVEIDANAIAQGQSVDIIARLLEANGCANYMVEIGGEVACKGVNAKHQKWRIGIEKPVDDVSGESKMLQEVLSITDCCVTTSGNYRKYFYLNGKKYSHEVDPHTGFPVSNNLMSATVVASSCMVADAYATAFMVLGVEKSMAVCQKVRGLECLLIYRSDSGEYKTIYTPGIKKYLVNK